MTLIISSYNTYPMPTETEPTSLDRITDYIRSYYEEHGVPATAREIQEHMGFKSPRAVTYYLDKLLKDGVIRKHRGLSVPEGYEVVETAKPKKVAPDGKWLSQRARYPVDMLLEILKAANIPTKCANENAFCSLIFISDLWQIVFFFDGIEADHLDHFIAPNGENISYFWELPNCEKLTFWRPE